MLKTALFILYFGFASFAFAQNNVEIKVDERINEEMRMKNAAFDTIGISGFRIQIFFGSDMSEAEAVMASFKAKFPDYATQVYKLYQQPSWKVRVGNFYREIDSQKLLHELREYYPDAFVVKDKINPPPLPEGK